MCQWMLCLKIGVINHAIQNIVKCKLIIKYNFIAVVNFYDDVIGSL